MNGATIVRRSTLVPEGSLYRLRTPWGPSEVLIAAPLTTWSIGHEGRWPMLSRYSRGMLELERDRRGRK